MKRLLFVLTMLNLLISGLALAQFKSVDTCYLPLEVGNKWQYIKLYGTDAPGYAIIETTVTNDTIFNNNRYFLIGSTWQRYDKTTHRIFNCNLSTGTETLYFDFRLPAGSTIGNLTASGGNQSFLGHTEYCRGFYQSSISFDLIRNYYMNNVGKVFTYGFQYAPGTNYTEYIYLVGFYSADISFETQIDPAVPVITITHARGRYDGSLLLNFNIKHKYSTGAFLGYSGDISPYNNHSYISMAGIKYFYSNQIDTVEVTETELTKISEFIYSLTIPMRYDLFSLGYKLYYQINATDKAITPHTSNLPATGFAELNLTKNENTDHYPLMVGNKWVYNVSQTLPDGSLMFEKKYLVKVEKDTILSNGKRYYKLKYGSQISFERIDTTLCQTFKASFSEGTIEDKLLDVLVGEPTQTYSLFRFGEKEIFSCNVGIPKILFENYSVNNRIFKQINGVNKTYTIGYNFGILEQNYDVVEAGTTKYYNLQLVGAYLNGVVYGDTNVVVGVEDENTSPLPKEYLLMQNYPNPFNPNTNISFNIPKESNVKLNVYNMLGKIVTNIFTGRLGAGIHSFEFNGTSVPSGIYFYRLEADNFITTKKMTLLK
ncbi:MAG: T9SS type A sorting domain-containing protein [bacterium]